MSNVTEILTRIRQGDTEASEELLTVVYGELRRLASVKMSKEKPGQTLQPTALVNDAYLRLTEGAGVESFENRRHFFGAAALAMQRILVDNARRKASKKRGGDWERVDGIDQLAESNTHDVDVLALSEALDSLGSEHPERAEVVRQRFFLGMTNEEIAGELDVSVDTVKRRWKFAQAWLFGELKDQ